MKLKLIVTCTLYLLSSSVKPLSETTAQWGSLGGGAALGATAGALMYYVILSNPSIKNTTRLTLSGTTALLVGGLSWYGLNELLNSMTPTGRFSAAHKMISLAEMDSLIARNFNFESEFLNHINARFGVTSWPLVCGQKHLISVQTNVLNAVNLLNLSINESENKPEYGDLPQRCQARREKAYIALLIIEERLSYIMNCKDYNFQVTLYEKHLEKERERTARAAEKSQDRLHDSGEREKDRLEKQKDRELKQNIVQNHHGPVMVSV